jgi:uncharacterized membrane protein YbhN (UPF0104 family)
VKRGHVWVGMGISFALVGYLFSRVDYGQLWLSLASADGFLLLAAAALLAGTMPIRAWRWQYLLTPLKSVGFSSAMSATSIGLMANMILPLRLGEIVRAAVLGYQERIDGSASFATVVVDRLLDGFTILLILATLLLTAPLPPAWGGGAVIRLLPGGARPAFCPPALSSPGALSPTAPLLGPAGSLGGEFLRLYGIL